MKKNLHDKDLGESGVDRLRLETRRRDGRGRIVIVGATSGIGLRSAVILALAGWRVGVAGRNEKVLKRLKAKFPDRIEYERIDVTKKDAPDRLLSLITKLGGMDIYFHVAGVLHINPDLDPDHDIDTIETNCVGFARMLDTAYHYYRCSGHRGRIAAITSVAGTRGIGAMASYSSSKRFGQTYLEALEQLARIQHVDVRFTDLRPGWIRTPLEMAEYNYPMNMKMSYAVPKILNAIMRGKRVAYIDMRWNAYSRVWRLLPPCVWLNMNPTIYTKATFEQMQENAKLEATPF